MAGMVAQVWRSAAKLPALETGLQVTGPDAHAQPRCGAKVVVDKPATAISPKNPPLQIRADHLQSGSD